MINLQYNLKIKFDKIMGFALNIDKETLINERLKGARLSIYFRWVFIALIATTLSVQLFAGYKSESLHSMFLVIIYLITNIILYFAVREKYDPRYLGFVSATFDVAIVLYHLNFLSSNFDLMSATAAATMFLFPVLFLLYTFRLDRGLLFYLIIISILGFNAVYYFHYFQFSEFFNSSLSLTPISHLFKSIYMMFIGSLCIYLQFSISKFIEKHIDEVKSKASLDVKIKIEEEKNKYSTQLIEKERLLNKSLETEIQEKEKLANELSESREQLHSILSNLVGAASRCMFDDNLTVVYYSEKIFDICGYPASDFVGNSVRTFASIIHPEDDLFCRNKIFESLETKNPYEFEYRIIHKNGNIVWAKETGSCVFDENGNLLYLDGITVDITKQKETEKAVKESEQRYKELMDFLPQPIFELDIYGNLTFSNKAGVDFFGVDVNKIKGEVPALEFFIEEDRPRIVCNFEESIAKNISIPEEYTALKVDGTLCPVIIYGTSIYKDGKPVGRRGIIFDISERKKHELSILKAKNELQEINNNLEKTIQERTQELTRANTQLLKLQKENLQSQFEVLKQQVNPHFLFNSLNVLTSLIKIEPDLAESFTEKLSKVYRYVLENKEKDLVSLATEMEFLNSYLFLLDIRFMNKLNVNIKIDKKYLDYLVIPIAVQLLIENAIKHNTFSKAKPLYIDVYVDENDNLVIINNLSVRETKIASTGVGLENIKNRYALVCDYNPSFDITDDSFVACLPLIKPNKNDNF